MESPKMNRFNMQDLKFKRILDYLPDGIYIVGKDYKLEYVNVVIRKEFGPVKGRECYRYFFDRKSRCPWCKFQEIEKGKAVQWEWESPKSERVYDLIDAPIYSSGGTLLKLKVMRDITRRKKAEAELIRLTGRLEDEIAIRTAELAQTVELLERIFNNSSLLIAYMDRGFNFIRVNKAYADADNKTPEYFVGRNHFDLYPHIENKKIFTRVINEGKSFTFYEKPFVYKDNPKKVTYWDWDVQPVKGPYGRVDGVLLGLKEVTKRKIASDELHKARAELTGAKRLADLGTLSAAIAHELRNPLGVIRTAAFNIKRKSNQPKLIRNINNIEKKVFESNQIINNLLFYAHLKMPEFQTIDIEALIKECVTTTVKRTEQKKAFVVKRNRIVERYFIEGDPFQLAEVFNNILLNAYQASENNRHKIAIRININQPYITVTVSDKGGGIPEEDIPNIFTPFFTKKSRGTGLGLSISQQIVHLHGGEIEANSRVGKGTEVKIKLPVKQKKD